MGNWGTSSRDFQLFFLLLYFAAIQTMAAISYFKYLQDSVYHRYENQPTFHFIDKMRRVSSFLKHGINSVYFVPFYARDVLFPHLFAPLLVPNPGNATAPL